MFPMPATSSGSNVSLNSRRVAPLGTSNGCSRCRFESAAVSVPSKRRSLNLTQGIAVRYGGFGVRCNAIAPGTIRTPIWQERVDRDPVVFERLVKWYPLGRVGEPDDIANAAMFLASDDAGWITGTVLRVDGGLLAGSHRMTRELLAQAGSEELDS